MKISYSRFSTYLKCPYAHYLGYIKLLKLKRPARPLQFGSDFHKLLELRNSPKELRKAKVEIGEKFYELPSNWQADLGESYIQDLATIFEDYQQVYKDSPQPHITEHRFDLLLGKLSGEPLIFTGVIDELYLYKKNGERLIKIGEHKTFNQKPDMNTLIMNTQKCLYAKATQKIKGLLPQTVIWDYIKSSPAISPIWLEKSGKFSLANSDKITEFSWRRACQERGIKEPCPDMYIGNLENFFFRVETPLDPVMVESIWEGFIYTSKDIMRQGHKNKTKNVTRDCKWCSYRDICMSEMSGGDTEYLIGKDYEIKEQEEDAHDQQE